MMRFLCLFILFLSAAGRAPVAADTLDTRMASQYHAIGYAHQKNGDFLQARLFYERALGFTPHDARLQNDMGLVLEAIGQSSEAEKYYQQAIAADHKCLPAYSNLAYLYKARGNMAMAARYFEQRVKFGDAHDPWTLQAQDELNRLVAFSPELSRERREFDQKALENAMALRAQEEIRGLRREKVVNAEMEYWRGFMLFDMHRYAEAREVFLDCLKQDPSYRPAKDMLDQVDTLLVMDPAAKGDVAGRDFLVREYTDRFQVKQQRDRTADIQILEAYVQARARGK